MKKFIKRVYAIKESESDFIVRVETNNSDACLCVCPGEWEADVVMAMVRACAGNMESQATLADARKRLAKWID